MSLKIHFIFCLLCFSLLDAKILTSFQELDNNIDSETSDSNNQGRINLSMPINFNFSRTKWCGPGNTAANYDDLGKYKEVDMCCRDHDFCDNIPAGESKHNLTNKDFFTVLDCDHQFHQCLHKINSKESNRIGRMYFSLRNHFYHDDSPIVQCDEYDTELFLRRCSHYKLDESQPKRYQWFDLPLYYDKNERDAMSDKMYDF